MTATDSLDPTARDWALFAYICGDNPRIAEHARGQIEGLLKFTGSARLHVAAQWDLPSGAERAVFGESGTWEHEVLHAVNTGDPEPFLSFLRWAFDRCPSDRIIVVASGTGLLDPRASMGGPDNDRAHLFTVCDDSSAGDALSLSEIRKMLARAVDASNREQIDIVALDMRELQCLEVAYELEGLAQVLIAPQTRVPDSGWNFEIVLRELDAALTARGISDPLPVHDMAQLLVRTVGAAYQATKHGELSLSALDLSALKGVASAFDTLSLAMVHSVGEELVWTARDTVAKRLKPRTTTHPTAPATDSVVADDDANDIDMEVEYLYDLGEMLNELRKEFRETADSGLTLLVLEHFSQLDAAAFQFAVQSLDDAAFTARSQLRVPALQASITDPVTTKRRLRKLIQFARAQTGSWSEIGPPMQIELADIFTDPSLRPPTAYSWLEGWPDDVVKDLEPHLAAQYMVARRQQQRLRHLAALTDRVLHLLTGAVDEKSGQMHTRPLVIEHFMSGGAERHGGVSLFRPRDLDQLIASDYLSLRFNQKIHWTVLLAVINLIGSHPRALWRILSAVLATADNSTRAELIDRIAGPGSVVAPFREQFVVLAPAKAFVLTLEPDPNATRATASHRTASQRKPDDDSPGPQAYRVRLELADREAFISEVTSIVDPEALGDVIDGLVELMKSDKPVTSNDVRRLESLGQTLGEDVLQNLGETLAESVDASRERIHLQLQLPRDLMGYPWELMHHKGGWLSEDFALGRQVFSRSVGRGLTSRMPGPLRALVIGNPPTEDVQLPYAAHEAEIIASRFAALASETDGLIDFKRERDARINQEVTRGELREMLRDGNYDIVHFAGHAAFDPKRPENSAWLLSDGPLYAQAIRNTLRWRDAQPWLVFANACEAGMDGTRPTMYQSDVFGLASAFLDNGVSVFIGPLWRIDDTIAASVALTFYEQLLGERQTVGEALRYAKVEAKKRHFDIASAPGTTVQDDRVARVSWAGLILYGNSTATIGQRVGAPSLNSPAGQRDDNDTGDAEGQ